MADQPPYLSTDGDHDEGLSDGTTAGTPRWVYVFGIIAVVVVLALVILLLIGGGHGPSRH